MVVAVIARIFVGVRVGVGVWGLDWEKDRGAAVVGVEIEVRWCELGGWAGQCVDVLALVCKRERGRAGRWKERE